MTEQGDRYGSDGVGGPKHPTVDNRESTGTAGSLGGEHDPASRPDPQAEDDALAIPLPAQRPRSRFTVPTPASKPNIIVTLDRKLAANQRGAVLRDKSKFSVSSGQIMVTPAPLEEDVARVALLFVDQLEYPINRRLDKSRTDPLGLVALGVMARSTVLVEGPPSTSALYQVPYEVFREHERTEPGCWTVWHGDGPDPLPDEQLEPGLGFKLRLQRCLIVPHRDVPIDDVLDFKERHRRELVSLRHHIEELCLKVSRNGLDPRECLIEAEKFDRAAADYVSALRKRNWRKSFANLEVSMNWGDVLKGTMAGAGASVAPVVALINAGNLTAAALGIAGAIGAGVTLTTTHGLRGQVAESPFRYLVQIDREFGIDP